MRWTHITTAAKVCKAGGSYFSYLPFTFCTDSVCVADMEIKEIFGSFIKKKKKKLKERYKVELFVQKPEFTFLLTAKDCTF